MIILDSKIKLIRKKHKISQEQMARMLDISLNHYQNIEKKKAAPNIYTGLQIAAILQIDPYELWSLKDELYIKPKTNPENFYK